MTISDVKDKAIAQKARRRAEVRASHLYHVSPSRNRESILMHGIEPSLFSQGKRKTAWYVDADRVMWAIIHVCRRHGVTLDEVDVWIVPSHLLRHIEKTSIRGGFQSTCRVAVKTYMSAWIAEQKQYEWLEYLS
jgi:hypothetical protein